MNIFATPSSILSRRSLIATGIAFGAALTFDDAAFGQTSMGSDVRLPVKETDISTNGMDLVRTIVQIYKNYGYKTQVLAASLRHPLHVIESALAGAHIGTMPFKVLDMLFNHPLTDKGLDQFLKDYAKVFQETPVAG